MQGSAEPSTTPVHGTPLGLLVFAIAWQAGSLVSDPALWPWAATDRLALVLLTCVWLGMVTSGLALTWRAMRRHLNVVLAINVSISVATSLVLLALDNPDVVAEWRAGASLVNVSVALMGLWLPARRALVLIVGTVLAEASVLVLRGSIGSEIVPWENDVMYPTYALVIGLSSSAVRSALERVRERTAHTLDMAQRTERQATISVAVEQSIREREVRIHEVVLNTLNALARGQLDGVPDALIKKRAAEAALVLEELGLTQVADGDNTQGSLRLMLADVVELAEQNDIEIMLSGEIPDDLPFDIRRAFRYAVREATINAVRHARASLIKVEARSRAGNVLIEVADDGAGFNTSEPGGGFGIRAAIVDGMEAVGGVARVRSSPGSGTTVTLEWLATQLPPSREMLTAERVAVIGPVIGIFTLFAVVSSIVTFPRIESFPGLLLALALLVASGALLVKRTREGRVTWPWSLATIALAAGVYLVQSASVDSDGSTWGEWGSEAASVLMFSVAAVGPRYVWAVAIAVWLLVQGDVIREIVAPGTIFIAVGALLGEILRKAAKQDFQNLQDQSRADIAMAGSRQVLSRLVARQEVLQYAHTSEMLRAVESDAIRWMDPDFREVWTRHERFLRTSLRLDPERFELHRLLARLVIRAWDTGVDLEISLGSWDVDVDIPHGLQESAVELISMCPEQSHVRCATIEDDQVVTLRIVATMSGQPVDSPEPILGVVMWDPSSLTAMWEMSSARKEALWR